jgi:hypothetical protein
VINEDVMENAKHNRTKIITLRLTVPEYNQIKNKFKAATCRKLSDYMRSVLLVGKVTVLTRNKSLDDFMTEMIQLRNDLNAIGNNYNQAVHKLHLVDQIPEFRGWILMHYVGQNIYGLTYVDFKSKCVFNGSDLGKEFSAKGLLEQLKPEQKLEVFSVSQKQSSFARQTSKGTVEEDKKELEQSLVNVNLYDVLQPLLKPERYPDLMPQELQPNKKKKKKSRKLGL